jgi:biopolymer transport protein ExbB
MERAAGLVFVLVLHAAVLWGLWQHRLLPAPKEIATVFVNFIAPAQVQTRRDAASPAARRRDARRRPGGLGEYLTRTLNNAVDREAAAAEHGLTVLASAGSAAPYIGLFGTVWGIYHALVQIGMSGQGTLDKVAGPVGEALIMTALGLAVAIPAVLAYNAFNRRNRVWLARLESFAHDLYVLLTVNNGRR